MRGEKERERDREGGRDYICFHISRSRSLPLFVGRQFCAVRTFVSVLTTACAVRLNIISDMRAHIHNVAVYFSVSRHGFRVHMNGCCRFIISHECIATLGRSLAPPPPGYTKLPTLQVSNISLKGLVLSGSWSSKEARSQTTNTVTVCFHIIGSFETMHDLNLPTVLMRA